MAGLNINNKISSTFLFTLLALPFSSEATTNGHAQMVSLNLQIRGNGATVKSYLNMPFYQTAELERTIDNKNVLIEINPRHGKNTEEVALEMKFYRGNGSKAFYKKDIIAKLNEESLINFKGMRLSVKPIIN